MICAVHASIAKLVYIYVERVWETGKINVTKRYFYINGQNLCQGVLRLDILEEIRNAICDQRARNLHLLDHLWWTARLFNKGLILIQVLLRSLLVRITSLTFLFVSFFLVDTLHTTIDKFSVNLEACELSRTIRTHGSTKILFRTRLIA